MHRRRLLLEYATIPREQSQAGGFEFSEGAAPQIHRQPKKTSATETGYEVGRVHRFQKDGLARTVMAGVLQRKGKQLWRHGRHTNNDNFASSFAPQRRPKSQTSQSILT